MTDFVIHMNSGHRDPTGSGDMKSWFFHYKWRREEEVFFPLPTNDVFDNIQAGDTLWFALDGVLIGNGFIDRVVLDVINNKIEAYYSQCAGMPPYSKTGPTAVSVASTGSGVVSAEDAKKWWMMTTSPVFPGDVSSTIFQDKATYKWHWCDEAWATSLIGYANRETAVFIQQMYALLHLEKGQPTPEQAERLKKFGEQVFACT